MRIVTLAASGSFLLAALGTGSCSPENPPVEPAADELVFGQFYGECSGERCIDIYKLDTRHQELLEDTKDAYPTTTAPYEGAFVPLATSFYRRAEDLGQYVPAQLLREPNGPIGQPDAGDWGGYYLEVNKKGKRSFWLLDTQKRNLPAYLHPLADTLRARIDQLP
ncbi:hypothetical protein HMJ29_02845 [Hymenobacter taeanensis]|uniref:Uncharacterized protein n=1 Tax=Hymenobacter taeanensis TaxID=2735321 RepID=A0A6M6BC03_9BACT|nr:MULTISPECIES: hypothetical protein [Hymenobacter]QJX45931.1 hypothetical protein HMJ29_02845 [Hymenobacter taeanensis]UOQ79777.1 hypothetical protein MUN83_13080 [Hymenobacter sp. 5414T-23]